MGWFMVDFYFLFLSVFSDFSTWLSYYLYNNSKSFKIRKLLWIWFALIILEFFKILGG